jgi:hypothetical protein
MVVVLLVLAHALVADHRLTGLHPLHEAQTLELLEDPAHRWLSSSSTTARRAPPRLCPAAASVASARCIQLSMAAWVLMPRW